MTDLQLFHKISTIKEEIAKLQDALPCEPRANCACDGTGHCAHHAAAYSLLDEAYATLERARTQLRFPNGVGDRAAF